MGPDIFIVVPVRAVFEIIFINLIRGKIVCRDICFEAVVIVIFKVSYFRFSTKICGGRSQKMFRPEFVSSFKNNELL